MNIGKTKINFSGIWYTPGGLLIHISRKDSQYLLRKTTPFASPIPSGKGDADRQRVWG